MSQDVIRIQLTPDQRQAVQADTGIDLEELAYPDPGGELNARFPDLPPGDVLNWAQAQAVVTAYENDRVASLAALDEEQAELDADTDKAIAEIEDVRQRAAEEKARMLAEADPKAKKKRRDKKSDSEE
jgi:hypothetical protein